MKYPPCPVNGANCRFTPIECFNTLMYSPVIRDREGKPVSGGGNTTKMSIQCITCKQRWTDKATELEIAQGREFQWLKAT